MTRFTAIDPLTNSQYCVDPSALIVTAGACASAPPPTAGFSPNALDRSTLNYSSHVPTESRVLNVPVRVMDNVAGRLNALGQPQGYGYINGSTFQIPGVGAGKLWQSMLSIPANSPVGVHHQFKGAAYGAGPPPIGTLTATNLPIDVCMYEVNAEGLFVPINRVGAIKTGVYMDFSTLLTFVTGPSDNQYWVPVLPGHNYVLEAKWHSPAAHGDMLFTWN